MMQEQSTHTALLQAVVRQRDAAMNQAAQLDASLAVVSAENERLAQRIAELEAKKPRAKKPQPE